MMSESKKVSKAKFSGRAIKKTSRPKRTSVIAEFSGDLGEIVDAGAEVTFGNAVKIANVFGEYTSLQTSIFIKMPVADAKVQDVVLRNLHSVLEPFNAKILHSIQTFQNQILEKVGADKIWGGKKPVIDVGGK